MTNVQTAAIDAFLAVGKGVNPLNLNLACKSTSSLGVRGDLQIPPQIPPMPLFIEVDPASKHDYSVHRHFPKAGVVFRGMAPFLRSGEASQITYNRMANAIRNSLVNRGINIVDAVAGGVATRGYFVAGSLSTLLGIGAVPIAKQGSLPGLVTKKPSIKEYTDPKKPPEHLETNVDAFTPGQAVLICDDLIAEGGTALSAAALVLEQKAILAAFVFPGVIPECAGVARLQKAFPDVPIIVGCVFDRVPDPNPSLSAYLEAFDNVDGLAITATHKPYQKILLMAHDSMYSWVRLLLGLYPEVFEFVKLGWSSFDDGMPNLDLSDLVADFKDRHIWFLMTNHDVTTLVPQMFMQYVLAKQRAASVTVGLPYFAGGTYERRQKLKEVATANPMLKALSVPGTTLIITDIHAQASEFFAKDTMDCAFLGALGRFLRLMDLSPKIPRYVTKRKFLACPDAGAAKRFGPVIEEFDMPVMIFEKTRGVGDKRIVRFVERRNWPVDAKGEPLALEHAIVIDDLALSGGTLLETGDALVQMGVPFIDCYITHARFPKQSFRRFLPKYNPNTPFKRVYCTDSIPDVQKAILLETANDEVNPFYYLPLAPHYVETQWWMEGLRSRKQIRVVVASSNVHKWFAVGRAFAYVFPYDDIHVVGCKTEVDPKVIPPQPLGEQTMRGAELRSDIVLKTFATEPLDARPHNYCLCGQADYHKSLVGSPDYYHSSVWSCSMKLSNSEVKAEIADPHAFTLIPNHQHRSQGISATYVVSIEDGLFPKASGGYVNKAALKITRMGTETSWSGFSEEVPVPAEQARESLSAQQQLVTAGELICQARGLPKEEASDWFKETYCDTRVQVLKLATVRGLYQLIVVEGL